MTIGAKCLVCGALLFIGPTVLGAQDRLWLVRGGQSQATIVAGRDDAYAAGRLQRWLAENAAAQVTLEQAETWDSAQPGTVILVGSAASNPATARLAKDVGLDLSPERLTAQGYLAKRLAHAGRCWIVLAGGSRDGSLYAVTDLFNWTLEHQGRDVWLEELDTCQQPRFRYRWFWNWDHRMDWGGPGTPGTKMGGGGKWRRPPEAFRIDCQRCTDFMADHKFNGLILWGFARDSHGGVEASQAVCRYARQRGVRVLPGVGTSGYAGYYFEGQHPFNANAWLAEHPELRAVGKDGKPHTAPCPSKQANQDWLDRGAEWLFQTFQIGGVNLEMGDFFVCYCGDCQRARAAIASAEPDYYKDMAISHMVTLKTMRRLSPEAWLSYATYTGYTPQMAQERPKFASMIPEDALCQWTLTGMFRRWPADLKPPTRHNVGYLHWCNTSTNTEDNFYLREVQQICQMAAGAEFEGLDTYGELPDTRPNAELFYLAWEAFLWQPDMSLDEFIERRLGRLYGGSRAARALVELMPLVANAAQRASVDNCARALALAQTARVSAAPQGRMRWDRLVAQLERFRQTAERHLAERRREQEAARQGTHIPVASVRASDEDRQRHWEAAKAIDGSVEEPAGYWLTQRADPREAWIELTLSGPAQINRVALFHQLNAGHYRSLDYRILVRTDGQWKPVAEVQNNQRAGWVAHDFPAVRADAVRVEITRSAHGNRMGLGEIEIRWIAP